MACKQSPCEKDLCDVYVELRKLIGNIDEFPLSPDKAGTVENHLKQLYDLTSMLLEQNDFQIVGSLDEMKEDGRLYVLRSTKSAYITINGSAFPISGSDSAVAESDPIYQADKALLALKSEVTPIAEKLNDLVEATTIVNDKLEHEITARFEADENLQEQIENEINDRFDSETDLQGQIDDEISARENADTTLNDKLTNETVVRGAADTLQLNKINANTSQISANTTSITTNKNLQDLVNAQYLNKITALENKTGKLIVTKNTGETDAQALARVITAPVDGMAAFVYDPNAHGNSNNLTEYLRINGAWIEQGTHTATVDLTAYYTKTESDAKFIDTIELQNLFNSYFEWLGAKTFTVGDRLPDATAQPTTGALADVGKITTWENQDWMLFEINQAGTLTYTWLPVAQGGSLSKGDTLHRDSVVEYFTTPDALKNIKILAGDLDTINYTFAEGVSGNLEVAPNATGQTTVGKFNLNNIDATVKANTAKNTQQDTAIAGKQDRLKFYSEASSDNPYSDVLHVGEGISGRQYYGFNATGSQYYGAAKWDNLGDNTVEFYLGKTLSTRYSNDKGTVFRTSTDGSIWTPTTNTADDLIKNIDTNYANINSIGDKQNKAISLSGITATNVEGALVELAGKGGGITNPIGNFTKDKISTSISSGYTIAYGTITAPNSTSLRWAGTGIYAQSHQHDGIYNIKLGDGTDALDIQFQQNSIFTVTSKGKHTLTATHTINELLDKVDTNYANIGTSPASPVDIENQIFEDLETESKTLVGAMNEILHMVKALQRK